jgi:adenylosuccinate synthase
VLDVPEEIMPVIPLWSGTQRARRLATLSTCFPVVCHSYHFRGFMLITGLINPKVNAFIGSGVVVHIPSLFNELDTLERKGKLYLSRCMDFS